MRIAPEGVISVGGGEADVVALQCDPCGIRRFERRQEVERELAAIGSGGSKKWWQFWK